MEDILEVYRRPYDPQRPLVCLDETSKQLTAETRVPIPANQDSPAGTITNTDAMGRPICS
jgi:hypothetical protein